MRVLRAYILSEMLRDPFVNKDKAQRLPLGRHGDDFLDFLFVRALPLVPGL